MIFFALQGFNFENLKVLISYLQRCEAIMQPQASLVFRLSYGVVSMFLSLIAAFKQRPAALLYRGKILQRFRSALNVTFSALATHEHCFTDA